MSEKGKKELVPGSDESIAASRKSMDDLVLKLAGKTPDSTGNQPLEMTPGEDGKATTTPPPVVPEPKDKGVTHPAVEPADADKTIAELRAQLAERDAKLADIDARFKKANGDYGGTLGKQADQIRELGEFIQTLQARVEKLNSENEGLKNKPAAPVESTIPTDLIGEDLRDIAPESAKKIEKYLADRQAENEAMMAKLAALEQGSTDTVKRAQDAEQQAQSLAIDRYNDQVLAAVPDAQDILTNPSYLASIRTPDEYGRVLEASIMDASKQLNHRPIIASMLAWKKANGKSPQSADEVEKARVAQESTEAERKAKLAGHSAPSSSAGGGSGRAGSAADDVAKRTERIANYERKRDVNIDSITKDEAAKYYADLQAERDWKLAQNSR